MAGSRARAGAQGRDTAKPANSLADLRSGAGHPACPAHWSISRATGAGLQIDRKSALPERFVLLIAGAEALKRACICVRRNGRNVGVRFNDAQFAWKKQDTSDSRQFASNNL